MGNRAQARSLSSCIREGILALTKVSIQTTGASMANIKVDAKQFLQDARAVAVVMKPLDLETAAG